jgi:hypothetical protein
VVDDAEAAVGDLATVGDDLAAAGDLLLPLAPV